MDPYGHHHHHNHNRRDERDEEDYPRPQPPPPYEDYPPPPPQSTHVHHSSHHSGGGPEYPHPPPSRVPDYYDPRRPEQPPPPPFQDFNSYAPPPPHVQHVQHVSHSSSPYGRDEVNEEEPHHFRPHMPSFISDHIHHQGGSDLGGKTSVRVFSKADTNYSLTIRDGKVILVRSDPSDPCQHWIKDEKYSIRVKDEQGFPSFALVNKATGQAIKHSIGATHPVQLIPYNPDVLDESVLWTESKDLGDGYRTIRMVNNIRLNFDAFDGNKNRGGVHDGTIIVLWEWGKKENQRWNIVPY